MNTFNRKCLICGSRYHLKAACDKVTEKGKWSAKPANATTVVYNSTRPAQYGTQSPGGGQSEHAASLHVPVNRVVLDRPTAVSVCDASTGRQSADASKPTATTATTGTTALAATRVSPSRDEIPTLYHSPTCTDSKIDFLDVGIESLVSLFDECEAPVNESDDCNNVNVTKVQFDMDRFIADSNVSLHYVNLIVNDDNGTLVKVDSLFDSGTQLSVIREDVIESLQYDVLGEVKLLGFNGNMSTGKVISLNARMKCHDASVPIRFVACQHVTQNCLLSLADYRKLLQNQEVRSVAGQTEGEAARGDDEGSFVPDVQRTQADTCREVST